MRTKKMNVSQFVQRAIDLGACKDGLALFEGKKGNVIKRIRKMCEIANRRWDILNYGESTYSHRDALRWFYINQNDFYDRGISLGFGLLVEPHSEDGYDRFRVEVIHD